MPTAKAFGARLVDDVCLRLGDPCCHRQFGDDVVEHRTVIRGGLDPDGRENRAGTSLGRRNGRAHAEDDGNRRAEQAACEHADRPAEQRSADHEAEERQELDEDHDEHGRGGTVCRDPLVERPRRSAAEGLHGGGDGEHDRDRDEPANHRPLHRHVTYERANESVVTSAAEDLLDQVGRRPRRRPRIAHQGHVTPRPGRAVDTTSRSVRFEENGDRGMKMFKGGRSSASSGTPRSDGAGGPWFGVAAVERPQVRGQLGDRPALDRATWLRPVGLTSIRRA